MALSAYTNMGQTQPVRASADQFEKMTLPRSIGADDAHEPSVLSEGEFDVGEVAPVSNRNVPYAHTFLRWLALSRSTGGRLRVPI